MINSVAVTLMDIRRELKEHIIGKDFKQLIIG
jgi:hypothetical protein